MSTTSVWGWGGGKSKRQGGAHVDVFLFSFFVFFVLFLPCFLDFGEIGLAAVETSVESKTMGEECGWGLLLVFCRVTFGSELGLAMAFGLASDSRLAESSLSDVSELVGGDAGKDGGEMPMSSLSSDE